MSQAAGPFLDSSGDPPDSWRGAVVAIGNFDGVHRGHQAVLAAARREAERLGRKAILLTFEPHPRAFFSGAEFFRLTPAPLKRALAEAFGMDGVLVLRFDAGLAGLSAEAFADDILVRRLAIVHAVTGFDFHFGHKRAGTPDFLRAAGTVKGFGVTVVEALTDAVGQVSSTRIRDALAAGNVAGAAGLLGWRWSVAGEVIRGDQRGRDLGYPTANMRLDATLGLAHGIYAIRYARPGGMVHDGVASYGRRPTFDNGGPLLESFLFDFSGDLYGEAGLISFVAFIRPERRFESAAALVAAMDADSAAAKQELHATPEAAIDRRIREAWRSGLPARPEL